MKKFLFYVCVLGFSVASLVSCYQYEEEELFGFSDLSVSNHTSLTRSGSNEGWDIIQSPVQRDQEIYNDNTEYPIEGNCCFLSMIVDRWISAMGDDYFYDPYCPLTAGDYYYQIKNSFQAANPDWVPGASVDYSVVMDFAGELTYGSSNNKLFSGQENVTDAALFFSSKENRSKVAAVVLEGPDGTGHIAHVERCTANKIYLNGEDILSNGGTINVAGEGGWRITGVVYK